MVEAQEGSNIHMAVDTLGHLLAPHVTPASAEDRSEVVRRSCTVQAINRRRPSYLLGSI